MMSTIAALATIGAASAFVAPTSFNGVALSNTVKSSTALKMADPATLKTGYPFGDGGYVFDPLNLAAAATDAQLKKYQEAELKHGRVAMMATLGFLVQENFHPLFNLQTDIGPAIYHFQLIEAQVPWFWEAVVFAIGLFEVKNISKGWAQRPISEGIAPLKEDYIVGDLGFDPLGFNKSEEDFVSYRNKELNNGRLAMIAIMGFWAQELVDGHEIFIDASGQAGSLPVI